MKQLNELIEKYESFRTSCKDKQLEKFFTEFVDDLKKLREINEPVIINQQSLPEEFRNLFQHWADSNSTDNYESGIKHFQD